MQPDLGLILGDQLSFELDLLQALDPRRDVLLMAEVRDETRYVPHHPQKIVLIFSAMRHFAEALRERGWQVVYVRLDDADNSGSIAGELHRWQTRLNAAQLHVTECGEWRLEQALYDSGLPMVWHKDRRFLCSRQYFAGWAAGRSHLGASKNVGEAGSARRNQARKRSLRVVNEHLTGLALQPDFNNAMATQVVFRGAHLRMESFYRLMRQRGGWLLEADGSPTGGAWNFDSSNRKSLPRGLRGPFAARFAHDRITQEVISLVRERFQDHYGSVESFDYPVTHAEAQELWQHFMEFALAAFGDYQDAMAEGEPFLFHARISAALNIGLLDVRQLCNDVEQAYRQGRVPLNAAEGFIRQLIGWREYVRGIYWLRMPEYAGLNALGNQRALPEFYWTGATGMRCMAQTIGQTLELGYAHHIQRLMITGNFALLAGITPSAICEWYLAVYLDAFDWVELPNTLGMVMHADGGYLGSKPYCASGRYIQRMSNYCGACQYSVQRSVEEDACPFNALYWHFLMRHQARFAANPRMAVIYSNLNGMDETRKQQLWQRGETLLARLDAGEAL